MATHEKKKHLMGAGLQLHRFSSLLSWGSGGHGSTQADSGSESSKSGSEGSRKREPPGPKPGLNI